MRPFSRLPKADAALRLGGAALVFLAVVFNFLSSGFIGSATAACPWNDPTSGGIVLLAGCTTDCRCTHVAYDPQPGCYKQEILCNGGSLQTLTRCVWQLCNCIRIDIAGQEGVPIGKGCGGSKNCAAQQERRPE